MNNSYAPAPATKLAEALMHTKVVGFGKMYDCYFNYETRFTKLENLNKVWIDTGIEI